jgi:acetyl esterase/lipase
MEQKTLEKTLDPLYWAPITRFTRLRYLVSIYLTKLLLTSGFLLRKLLARFGAKPLSSGKPTLSKVYPCRPKLRHRVFFPKSYEAGKSLPLYIDVHGGGFCFGIPEHDDEFCHFFANHFNLIVISVNYSLAPRVVFPAPSHDVAAVIEAILSDDTLPIDHSRVAVGGFSAGGNLALSASQMPALQGKIRAAIAWYAPVDWSVGYEEKCASRPYKVAGEVDGLAAIAPVFNNVYLTTGTDQRDPLLSILYADRKVLPPWVYSIGAEYDMLCDESRRMMARLAGKEELTESEKEAFETEGGQLRWTMVKGAKHSFTHWWLRAPKVAALRKPTAEKMFMDAGKWLTEQAFAE